MKKFSQEVKWIAGELLDAIIITVSCIFILVAIILKFVVSLAGIATVSAVIYSTVFGGNVEALLSTPGRLIFSVLTLVFCVVDYMVASNV